MSCRARARESVGMGEGESVGDCSMLLSGHFLSQLMNNST